MSRKKRHSNVPTNFRTNNGTFTGKPLNKIANNISTHPSATNPRTMSCNSAFWWNNGECVAFLYELPHTY